MPRPAACAGGAARRGRRDVVLRHVPGTAAERRRIRVHVDAVRPRGDGSDPATAWSSVVLPRSARTDDRRPAPPTATVTDSGVEQGQVVAVADTHAPGQLDDVNADAVNRHVHAQDIGPAWFRDQRAWFRLRGGGRKKARSVVLSEESTTDRALLSTCLDPGKPRADGERSREAIVREGGVAPPRSTASKACPSATSPPGSA